MAIDIYRSDPDAPQPPKRPLRRWELLIMDGLTFYEKTPGGATAKMVAEYISPRLGWWERWWVVGTVYAKLYAMVERGWIEDYQIDPPPPSKQRYRYRIARRLPFDWTEINHDLKDVH